MTEAVERYWTLRSRGIFDELVRATESLEGGAFDDYAWKSADKALTSRDAEGLCALFRLADARSAVSSEMRFATAMRAMERRYYDCAYAAWDDAGCCWADIESHGYVPDSKTSAGTMMRACDRLLALETADERELCASMERI